MIVVSGSIFAAGAGYAIALARQDGAGYLPRGSAAIDSEREVALIYFGASGCQWSNQPDFPPALEELKATLQNRLERAGIRFAATGVALDWSVSKGSEHLEKFGYFDEVAIGRSWLNSAAQRYIWRDIPGRGGTPQIVVVLRRIEVPATGGDYLVSDEELLLRKVGYGEIMEWISRGAILPSIESLQRRIGQESD